MTQRISHPIEVAADTRARAQRDDMNHFWWSLLRDTASAWSHDKIPRMAAALAYYTVLSLPGILVISLAVSGLVFGADAARGQFDDQLRDLLGDNGAKALDEMINSAQRPARGIIASLLGLIVLLFGASGVFGELKDGLNTIWQIQPNGDRGIWTAISSRFLSFAMVLGTGFLLLVSLVLSAALSAAGKWSAQLLPGPEAALQLVEVVVSFGVISALFAMLFKFLPDQAIRWRDVWIGACATAMLFTAGKYVLGIYLGHASIGSAYGAAGSLVVVLIWVYYSAQILYLGAEFTRAFANARAGERLTPRYKKLRV